MGDILLEFNHLVVDKQEDHLFLDTHEKVFGLEIDANLLSGPSFLLEREGLLTFHPFDALGQMSIRSSGSVKQELYQFLGNEHSYDQGDEIGVPSLVAFSHETLNYSLPDKLAHPDGDSRTPIPGQSITSIGEGCVLFSGNIRGKQTTASTATLRTEAYREFVFDISSGNEIYIYLTKPAAWLTSYPIGPIGKYILSYDNLTSGNNIIRVDLFDFNVPELTPFYIPLVYDFSRTQKDKVADGDKVRATVIHQVNSTIRNGKQAIGGLSMLSIIETTK